MLWLGENTYILNNYSYEQKLEELVGRYRSLGINQQRELIARVSG